MGYTPPPFVFQPVRETTRDLGGSVWSRRRLHRACLRDTEGPRRLWGTCRLRGVFGLDHGAETARDGFRGESGVGWVVTWQGKRRWRAYSPFIVNKLVVSKKNERGGGYRLVHSVYLITSFVSRSFRARAKAGQLTRGRATRCAVRVAVDGPAISGLCESRRGR